MGRFLSGLLIMFALVSSSACASNAGTHSPRITGLFSNMVYNSEGGDVLGMEILLVNSKSGYFAVYQSSEGEPNAPAVLRAKVSGNVVEFAVPADIDSRGLFRGVVTSEELIGTFSSSEETVSLKRGVSYWN